MRVLLVSAAAALGLRGVRAGARVRDASAADAGAAEPEVGTAVLIKKKVTGKLGTDERRARRRAFACIATSCLQTGPEAQAELKLDDNTKLALGPDAELRLDEYRRGGRQRREIDRREIAQGHVAVPHGQAMPARPTRSRRRRRPSASAAQSSTSTSRRTAIPSFSCIKGEVEVCSRARTCRPHRDVGRVVQATVPGVVSQPMKWTANLVPGVGVTQAFPFVGKRLVIDPVRRLTHDGHHRWGQGHRARRQDDRKNVRKNVALLRARSSR